MNSTINDIWIEPELWDTTTAPKEVYVILTDDGPHHKNVFLAFDNAVDGYTTVDYFDEINLGSICKTIADAEYIAKAANSSTYGGWSTPMHIIKVTNFRDAYFNVCGPEYTIIKTLNFN